MRLYTVVQIDDFELRKSVCEKIALVVEEMSGEIVKAGGFGDVFVVARFPHRKHKTYKKAVAAALASLPVKGIIVERRNPYLVRKGREDLTSELYRRQDEALGCDARSDSE
jgi:hypothetical protein